jgi:hypothetical protein
MEIQIPEQGDVVCLVSQLDGVWTLVPIQTEVLTDAFSRLDGSLILPLILSQLQNKL